MLEAPRMDSIHIDTDDPLGPFGAKEAGEGTQLAPAPAIVNAIADAIGVEFDRLPVTPRMVLDALNKLRDEQGDRAMSAADGSDAEGAATAVPEVSL
jgi:hypothetical protein